jgi:hypothetical protein
MRPRRVRFTIRGLMIALLVVAILLTVPIRFLMFLMFYTTILAIMFRCACRLAITNHSVADSSTRWSHNMRPFRNHLTLIDLMATVAAAALAMGVFVWGGIPPEVPALIVLFWLSVPLVGIVWDRWRGCSGILGGALGGAAEAGVALILVITGPHGPGEMGALVVLFIAGFLTFGTSMGVATWLVAAAMGQSVASKVPSRNDQFVHQR